MKSRVVVIGGGIVGLATGLKLLNTHPNVKVTILEKEDFLAAHQTGHNSGVLHCGLYYKPGTYKAKLCVQGLKEMIQFCEQNEIPFERCGKVVVATSEAEIPQLKELYNRGLRNGLKGLKELSQDELKEREPFASGLAAILVPEEGIVDYKKVCLAMALQIQRLGGEIKLGHKVEKILWAGTRWNIQVSTRENTQKWAYLSDTYNADFFVNCAGLFSDRVAEMTGVEQNIQIVPFRGEYYKLKPHAQKLVNHLIYPVPDLSFPFLGVHFTRMIGGGVECGPNAVLAFKREGYSWKEFSMSDTMEMASFGGFWKFTSKHFRPGMQELWRSLSKKRFCSSLQKLIPSITPEDIEFEGAGVRAQAMNRDGTLVQDFAFEPARQGLHVINTPSPAATASLAIGQEIVSRLDLV